MVRRSLVLVVVLLAAACGSSSTGGPSGSVVTTGGPYGSVVPTGGFSELSVAAPHLDAAVPKLQPIHSNGAIGFNWPTWHAAAEQRRMSPWVLKGLATQDPSALSSAVRAMELTFAHQSSDGSFQYSTPPGATNPSKTNDPVGVSFFYADLGHSLSLLSESTWFQTSASTAPLRQRIDNLREEIASGLNWLLAPAQYSALQQTGQSDTNRWTFGSNSLILVGQYVGNQTAIQQGMKLLEQVMSRQQPDGTLPENGGFDSSYQGVSLYNLSVLWFHLSAADSSVKPQLTQVVDKGVDRERQAISSDGTIQIAGNTRVYCGGEQFRGQQKGGDYQTASTAILYDAAIRHDPTLVGVAQAVVSHYAKQKGGPAGPNVCGSPL